MAVIDSLHLHSWTSPAHKHSSPPLYTRCPSVDDLWASAYEAIQFLPLSGNYKTDKIKESHQRCLKHQTLTYNCQVRK